MTSSYSNMPRVPQIRQPRIQAPRSQLVEMDSSPVRTPYPVDLHCEENMEFSDKKGDNLTDISIDSFSSEINLIPDGALERENIEQLNNSIAQWLGQEYVMRPTINQDPNNRLDWDRWATPIAEFVEHYFPDKAHNNPVRLKYPYCGVMAYFINRCIIGDASAKDYLACLLGRVLSKSVRSPTPMLKLLIEIFPFMQRRGLVEHHFFKNLAWHHERGIEFVMWERSSFVLYTTLPAFEANPSCPLDDPSIFSMIRQYLRPVRMQAPPPKGLLRPAPCRPRSWLSTAGKIRKEKILKASVAVTRGRRETQLPTRYKV